MKKKKYILQSVLVGAVVLIVAVGGGFVCWQKWQAEQAALQEKIKQTLAEKIVVCEKIKKIDGLCYDGESEPGVYAVMIENHSEARPQSGIADASLVYEAIVEAPITRFLAIFSADRKVEKIGPVRSARPFYVDWAKEFGAPYAHVGGSDAALKQLAAYKYDLNEFFNGKYFWRSSTRTPPHNVYTSFDFISRAVADKAWTLAGDFETWLFKPDAALAERGDVKSIKVDFLTPAYAVEWRYEKDQNEYVRLQSGHAHVDSVGKIIRAKNVAVMHVKSKVIDDYGRLDVQTLGNGAAEIFLDGKMFSGKWRRNTLNERTRFFNDRGDEIRFNAGATWIEVKYE